MAQTEALLAEHRKELLYQRAIDPGVLHEVLALPLVPSWRVLFERRLERGAIEDWRKRLTGVAPDE